MRAEQTERIPPNRTGGEDRSVPEIVRSIATGTGTLVRKEVELARHEITDAVGARARAVAIVAAGGVFAVVGLFFLGLSAMNALRAVLPTPWVAPLLVGFGFVVLGMFAAGIATVLSAGRSMSLEETRRTLKEDVEWARAQLKR